MTNVAMSATKAVMTNDELRAILQRRLQALESNPARESKTIDLGIVQSLLRNLALPNDFAPLAHRILELSPRAKLVWLHLAECSGCTESLLRTSAPSLHEFIFDIMSIEYHETFMVPSGWHADECLERLLASGEDFILAVEGSVSPIDTHFFTISARATNGYELLRECANKAKVIFAMGSCSCYGGIQAAAPNPSGSCSVSEVLGCEVINIPGCPPSDVNMMGSLLYFVLFGAPPALDSLNRPQWSYGRCLHNMCERKSKFYGGIFAEQFDDALAKEGACLLKLGCKGPYAYNNCPKVKFNDKTSWPVAAGHGCIACCEPNFWDDFGFYEVPMINANAYNDFSFVACGAKGAGLPLGENPSDENALLCLENKLGLLYNTQNSELCDFLSVEFEANPKLILRNLAASKSGALLMQNYRAHFAENYAFIERYFDEIPRVSSDLGDFFAYIYMVCEGKEMPDINAFYAAAMRYKFKHASPFEIKLSVSENGAKIDFSKSWRMPLVYLCGGLDLEAIAFSACEGIFTQLKAAAQNLRQSGKQICLKAPIALNGENLAFLRSRLA